MCYLFSENADYIEGYRSVVAGYGSLTSKTLLFATLTPLEIAGTLLIGFFGSTKYSPVQYQDVLEMYSRKNLKNVIDQVMKQCNNDFIRCVQEWSFTFRILKELDKLPADGDLFADVLLGNFREFKGYSSFRNKCQCKVCGGSHKQKNKQNNETHTVEEFPKRYPGNRKKNILASPTSSSTSEVSLGEFNTNYTPPSSLKDSTEWTDYRDIAGQHSTYADVHRKNVLGVNETVQRARETCPMSSFEPFDPQKNDQINTNSFNGLILAQSTTTSVSGASAMTRDEQQERCSDIHQMDVSQGTGHCDIPGEPTYMDMGQVGIQNPELISALGLLQNNSSAEMMNGPPDIFSTSLAHCEMMNGGEAGLGQFGEMFKLISPHSAEDTNVPFAHLVGTPNPTCYSQDDPNVYQLMKTLSSSFDNYQANGDVIAELAVDVGVHTDSDRNAPLNTPNITCEMSPVPKRNSDITFVTPESTLSKASHCDESQSNISWDDSMFM